MKHLVAQHWRRAVMIVGTLLIAFGSGYVMQTGLQSDTPVSTNGVFPDAAPLIRDAEQPRTLPIPPAATLHPIRLDRPVIGRVPPGDAPVRDLPHDSAALVPAGVPCRSDAAVTALPAGMLQIVLNAPCDAAGTVRLRHGPLDIAAVLDASGRAQIELPVLDVNFGVDLDFPDGSLRQFATDIASAQDVYRVALAWSDAKVLELHALEYGAAYGSRGHVHAASPRSPDRALRGAGGFLTQVGDGDAGGVAVYTFPRADAPSRGVVRVSIEAEVTRATCGKPVSATAFQSGALGGLEETRISLVMPDCTALGDIVQLKNLFRDLTLAGR
jgi:hypothetical protein